MSINSQTFPVVWTKQIPRCPGCCTPLAAAANTLLAVASAAFPENGSFIDGLLCYTTLVVAVPSESRSTTYTIDPRTGQVTFNDTSGDHVPIEWLEGGGTTFTLSNSWATSDAVAVAQALLATIDLTSLIGINEAVTAAWNGPLNSDQLTAIRDTSAQTSAVVASTAALATAAAAVASALADYTAAVAVVATDKTALLAAQNSLDAKQIIQEKATRTLTTWQTRQDTAQSTAAQTALDGANADVATAQAAYDAAAATLATDQGTASTKFNSYNGAVTNQAAAQNGLNGTTDVLTIATANAGAASTTDAWILLSINGFSPGFGTASLSQGTPEQYPNATITNLRYQLTARLAVAQNANDPSYTFQWREATIAPPDIPADATATFNELTEDVAPVVQVFPQTLLSSWHDIAAPGEVEVIQVVGATREFGTIYAFSGGKTKAKSGFLSYRNSQTPAKFYLIETASGDFSGAGTVSPFYNYDLDPNNPFNQDADPPLPPETPLFSDTRTGGGSTPQLIYGEDDFTIPEPDESGEPISTVGNGGYQAGAPYNPSGATGTETVNNIKTADTPPKNLTLTLSNEFTTADIQAPCDAAAATVAGAGNDPSGIVGGGQVPMAYHRLSPDESVYMARSAQWCVNALGTGSVPLTYTAANYTDAIAKLTTIDFDTGAITSTTQNVAAGFPTTGNVFHGATGWNQLPVPNGNKRVRVTLQTGFTHPMIWNQPICAVKDS